jgi:hypothetical protein
VLGSTEDEQNHFHGNALWFVADNRPDAPELLYEFEPAMKVEGIAQLASLDKTTERFVIVYDNDPNKTHIPSRIQTLLIRK